MPTMRICAFVPSAMTSAEVPGKIVGVAAPVANCTVTPKPVHVFRTKIREPFSGVRVSFRARVAVFAPLTMKASAQDADAESVTFASPVATVTQT